MKVAHFSIFGPNRCGLYHTAKELVVAERMVGIDARFIAVDEKNNVSVHKDGSFTTEKLDWAYKADVLVRHSSIPEHIHNSGKPVVMALHGRPESSVLLAKQNNPVVPAMANKAMDCRYKKFVTFWPEYEPIWRNIVGSKIAYVPACVDPEEYPRTKKQWDVPHILICDLWREDKTPFEAIMAAHKFALENEGAKVYVVGLDKDLVESMSPFFAAMRNDGVFGGACTLTKDIKDWYAKCNILVTPHTIATRSIREASASGLKIARPDNITRVWKYEEPATAESYSMAVTGNAMRLVLESVMPKKPESRKVFVDIGGHLGESVRRFYREVEDADEYEIYCFEPDVDTFAKMDANIGHIKNVSMINACAGTVDGMVTFYQGSANDNEGGTICPGKQSGGIDYGRPFKVESLDFGRWCENNLGDYNIVKINIEGGEYELMDMFLKKGMVFDKLFIQLHAHKFAHGKQRRAMQAIEGEFAEQYAGKVFLSNKGVYPFHAE